MIPDPNLQETPQRANDSVPDSPSRVGIVILVIVNILTFTGLTYSLL